MTPERWQQIERLYQRARAVHAADERARVLASADPELRREVEALLANEPADNTETLVAPVAIDAGFSIDHYRIVSKLGEGGMGAVYKALDTKLNRPVAIKFLSSDLADAEARRRFQREAQMASSLNHPHIVTVYDAGEIDGRQYLVTEYVDGGTLKDWAAKEKRSWKQVVDLLTGVADGLAAAHQAGIVHRDIKPTNILVAKNGYAKLADFGLAKLAEATQMDVAPPVSQAETRPGMIVGTIAYMSPEQASGLAIDARSDIFSFGIVLYEMLAGKRPFHGATDLELLERVIHETAPPLSKEIPLPMRLVVEKSLAKDPGERYQSIREMVVDLRRLTQGSDAARAPFMPRWAWGALLPVLVGAGFFAWRASRPPETAPPLQAVPLTALQGSQRYPTFSPDGNYVAFTWTGLKQDNPDVYVQQIGASGTPLRLTTDQGNDYNPVWSPDGRWIAFLRRAPGSETDDVRIIPPLGGTERRVGEIHMRGTDLNAPPYLCWCPDATCLVATDSPGEGKADGLFVISFETGEKRQLTSPQAPATGDTDPAISPDGKWIIFRRTNGGVYDGELYRLRLEKGVTAAGQPEQLTQRSLDAQYPAWMPDGKQILFSTTAGGLWKLNLTGDKPVPERLPFIGEGGVMPVVSRPQNGQSSRLVYVRNLGDGNVGRVDLTAPGAPSSAPPAVAAMSTTRNEGMVHLSPDGRQVAFWSTRSGFSEIWAADLDGANSRQLTSVRGAFATGAPRWSTDGRSIAFHSNASGQSDVWIVPSTGGKAVNLTSHPALDAFPSFSHDGQWIYFSSNRETHTQQQVFKIPVSGGEAVRLTAGLGNVPIESTDGKYLYYVEYIDKPSPVWRIPVSGGEPVKVLDQVFLGNYDVIERGIYYVDTPKDQGSSHYLDKPSGEIRLKFYDFAKRHSTTVVRNLGLVDVGLSATQDGRTILYTRMDAAVDDLMLVENFR